MANIIDALFITLGLDTREYQKSQKEVGTSLKKLGETSDKQTKLIAEHGKKAAGAFSALKIEILGALAAFGMGAGFKAFIESSMNGQAQLGRLSTALGMSTQSLQAWKLMAKEMGGTGEEAIGTLNKVASGLASARRGDVSFLTSANKYGAGLTLDDNVQSAMSKINRMASAIRQKYGEQQAMGVLGEMGISDFNQQQRLMETPAQFAADFAHAMSLTGAATKASTEQAARLQAQWADLQERFQQVGQRVFDKLEPVLARLGEELADWLDSIDWNAVIRNVEKFFQSLQQVVQSLGGVKGILIEIAAIKVFGWIASVGMWVVKLRSLTAALAAARAASAAGGAAEVAGGAAAGGALGLLGKAGAVTGAGAAGWFAGSLISKYLVEGTKFGDAIGAGEAHVMAFLGSSAAREAIAQNRTNSAREMQAKHRAQALAYFTSQGWTPQQAAGIVANLTAESGLRTNAVGDSGNAYGIAQWHKDRQQAFEKFTGHPIQGSSFADQLAFVNHELQTSEKRAGDRLRTAGSAADAASLVSLLYERPAGGQAEAERRAKMAQSLSTAYVGARPEVARTKPSEVNNDVHIGKIEVHTKATDAFGVAKDMRKAVRDNPLIAGYVTASA